jgi:hypothetical protein
VLPPALHLTSPSLTNPLLLIAIGLFAGGFTAINRFAPESVDVGGRTVTQKHMYTALFAVGFVLLFLAGPISVFFWLVASSTIIILGHATLMETGLESEYQNIESAA